MTQQVSVVAGPEHPPVVVGNAATGLGRGQQPRQGNQRLQRVQGRHHGPALALEPESIPDLRLGANPRRETQVVQDGEQVSVAVETGVAPCLGPEAPEPIEFVAVDTAPDAGGRLQDHTLYSSARREMGRTEAADTRSDDNVVANRLRHRLPQRNRAVLDLGSVSGSGARVR